VAVKPDTIEVEREAGEGGYRDGARPTLVIRRRGRRLVGVGILVVFAVWIVMLIVFARTDPGFGGAFDISEASFVFLVLVGLLLVYFGVANIVNRVTIRVSGDRIALRDRPLPIVQGVDIAASGIIAIGVEAGESGFSLMVMRDGRAESLSLAAFTEDEALYLAETLREHLGLPKLVIRYVPRASPSP
jgi:hypothetical protein